MLYLRFVNPVVNDAQTDTNHNLPSFIVLVAFCVGDMGRVCPD